MRQLQNTLAALAVQAERRGTVGPAALSDAVLRRGTRSRPLRLDEARRAFDAQCVREALACAAGQRTRAATELGLTRQGLAKLMVRLGMARGGGRLTTRSPTRA